MAYFRRSIWRSRHPSLSRWRRSNINIWPWLKLYIWTHQRSESEWPILLRARGEIAELFVPQIAGFYAERRKPNAAWSKTFQRPTHYKITIQMHTRRFNVPKRRWDTQQVEFSQGRVGFSPSLKMPGIIKLIWQCSRAERKWPSGFWTYLNQTLWYYMYTLVLMQVNSHALYKISMRAITHLMPKNDCIVTPVWTFPLRQRKCAWQFDFFIIHAQLITCANSAAPAAKTRCCRWRDFI